MYNKLILSLERRDYAVVRKLATHQCGPSAISASVMYGLMLLFSFALLQEFF